MCGADWWLPEVGGKRVGETGEGSQKIIRKNKIKSKLFKSKIWLLCNFLCVFYLLVDSSFK